MNQPILGLEQDRSQRSRKEAIVSDTHSYSPMALVEMDVQESIVSHFAHAGDFLERIETAITAARRASIPVISVRVAFRPSFPEISLQNKAFTALKQQQGSWQTSMTTTEIDPAIAPQLTDIVVTKRRVSAFRGSD